jgi:hypothetical protein
MKTPKIIAAAGLFIMATFLISSVTFAGGKTLRPKVPPPGNQIITYVVHIEETEALHNGSNFWVELKNQDGALIGKQAYVIGEMDYTFTERGPVKEARFVTLSWEGKLLLAKDVKFGPFEGGHHYQFLLIPIK